MYALDVQYLFSLSMSCGKPELQFRNKNIILINIVEAPLSPMFSHNGTTKIVFGCILSDEGVV